MHLFSKYELNGLADRVGDAGAEPAIDFAMSIPFIGIFVCRHNLPKSPGASQYGRRPDAIGENPECRYGRVGTEEP